jgi:hypothetical protein
MEEKEMSDGRTGGGTRKGRKGEKGKEEGETPVLFFENIHFVDRQH